MKRYEVVWEIFNKCSNNQMRDIFIEEIETEDVDKVIKDKFKEKDLTYEKEVLDDGTIIFNLVISGMKERYSFTEI